MFVLVVLFVCFFFVLSPLCGVFSCRVDARLFNRQFNRYLQVAAGHPVLSGVYEHVNAQFQFALGEVK